MTSISEANRLSKHKGPSSTDYQKLLHHLCHDECEAFVNQTIKNIKKMTRDAGDHRPSEQSCADNGVRKVEAEILGCCGCSCGSDGRSCMSLLSLPQQDREA